MVEEKIDKSKKEQLERWLDIETKILYTFISVAITAGVTHYFLPENQLSMTVLTGSIILAALFLMLGIATMELLNEENQELEEKKQQQRINQMEDKIERLEEELEK